MSDLTNDPQNGADSGRNYRRAIYASYVSRKTRPAGRRYERADYDLWARAARARLAGWLPPDRAAPILDIGCGSGNLLYALAQAGYSQLTGIDLSPEQLELARQWCPRATLLHGDAQDFLARSASQFDLITGFDIVEHFGKDEILPLLELIARALKPGGRLILQTPNADSPWFGAVAYLDFTHEWFFTPDSLADLLRLAGFSGYAARPNGPYAHGLKSGVRRVLWAGFSAALALWNLAEVGHRGSGIYTRVFIATARKAAGGENS